jgi:hypothetical protein
MKEKDQIEGREYQRRVDTFLNGAFTTQLQPLRSLKTATKRRRELRKQAEKNCGPMKTGSTAPGA